MASELPSDSLGDDLHDSLAAARIQLSVKERTEEILSAFDKQLDEDIDHLQSARGSSALERLKIEALAHVNALAAIHCESSRNCGRDESHFWSVAAILTASPSWRKARSIDEGYLRAAFDLILST